MVTVWLILFILLIICFWLLNLIGLPGNWMIVGLAGLWYFLGPLDFRFSWIVLAVLIGLALIGEAIEFGASVLGTKKLGGSTRGATLSIVGSIAGALIGAIVGIPIPIPILGMLIGTLLFAAGGAWLGAFLGEKWSGKPTNTSLKIGNAAFVGRLLGTVGKLVVGTTMVVLASAAPFIF